MGIKAGNLPVSTIDNTDYLLITEGEAPKRANYADVKKDIIGTETLTQTGKTIVGAINENNTQLSKNTQNINNLGTNKIDKTSIVNNLTTTAVGLVLDATQGKILAERIMMYKLYPTFTNGVATITLSGITSSSLVMAQWLQGGPVIISSIGVSANTITLNASTNATGIAAIMLLIQK